MTSPAESGSAAAAQFFCRMVDEANDIVEVIEPTTGRMMAVNRRGCEMLGYSHEEILRLCIRDLAPTLSVFDWRRRVEIIREQGVLVRRSTRMRRDGTVFPVELSARWVPGPPPYIVAVVRDISAQADEEERLREQVRLLDLATDAIILAEVPGERVLYWNKAAEALLGASSPRSRDATLTTVLRTQPEVLEHIHTVVKTHGEWRGEMDLETCDGRRKCASVRATVVYDAAGLPASVLLWLTDVSDRKALEEQYLRAQRTDSLGTLASGMAHDLNNVLTPVLASLAMLDQELPADERRRILELISADVRRGADIVRQVLTYACGIDGHREKLRIESILNEPLRMAQGTFPRSIAISEKMGPALWEVVGDRTHLQQVVLNLIINARDAMPHGGTLTVEAANFPVQATLASMIPEATRSHYVRVQIADTGTGIPPALHRRIFEPFFTTREPGTGLGLGLSAAEGIVRSHGGFIRMESTPEHGSTFSVYLPAENVSAEAEAESMASHGHGELILLVDDVASIRDVSRKLLEAHGYRVLLAGHGAEAVAIFAQQGEMIDLVITDAIMPILDGASLVRALRRMRPEIPVIGTSGFRYEAQAAAFRQLELREFIPKPYEAQTLLAAVQRVLRPEK